MHIEYLFSIIYFTIIRNERISVFSIRRVIIKYKSKRKKWNMEGKGEGRGKDRIIIIYNTKKVGTPAPCSRGN